MRKEDGAAFSGRHEGWISSVDRKHFGDPGADDREALIQQQYEMKRPPVQEQGQRNFGGGVYEADEGAQQTVFEVPGNVR